MTEYRLKGGKIGEKVVDAYKKVEDAFVETFLDKEEDGSVKMKTGGVEEKVVGAYKNIEEGVVGAYKKVEGAFVDTFLEKVEEKNDEEK